MNDLTFSLSTDHILLLHIHNFLLRALNVSWVHFWNTCVSYTLIFVRSYWLLFRLPLSLSAMFQHLELRWVTYESYKFVIAMRDYTDFATSQRTNVTVMILLH